MPTPGVQDAQRPAHAGADPFVKVKAMIKDLIVQSMEQANSESDKKAYCDTELATNKATRENKQSEVDELAATVDKHVAESTQLGEELAFLAEALGHLRQELLPALHAPSRGGLRRLQGPERVSRRRGEAEDPGYLECGSVDFATTPSPDGLGRRQAAVNVAISEGKLLSSLLSSVEPCEFATTPSLVTAWGGGRRQ